MIALAFFAGMLAVLLVLPIEEIASNQLTAGLSVTVALAAIEEMTKYILVALIILWQPSVDEPLDYVIYLVTVALGFAALENAFYLFNPLSNGHILIGALTDNVRFVGSTLLHVVASATIGFALAFSCTKTLVWRISYITLGVILAILLHTVFNLIIMSNSGAYISDAFLFVWIGVVIVFALFEVLKYRTYKNLPTNVC